MCDSSGSGSRCHIDMREWPRMPAAGASAPARGRGPNGKRGGGVFVGGGAEAACSK